MQLGKNSPRWKSFLKLDKESGLFLVEGPKLLEEARRGRHPLRYLLHDPARWRPNFPFPGGADAECVEYEVTPEMLQRLSDAQTCQGVVGVAEARSWGKIEECATLVVAEQLADPGNLGTLLRTAWAAGVDGLVTLGGVDPFSPKVVRASAGAIFHVPVFRLNSMTELAGWTKIGLTPHAGTSLYEVDWPQRWALLVGNEAHGLSPETISGLDLACRIPMAPGCESLNAATSAAIVLFEWRRAHRTD